MGNLLKCSRKLDIFIDEIVDLEISRRLHPETYGSRLLTTVANYKNYNKKSRKKILQLTKDLEEEKSNELHVPTLQR